MKARKVQQLEPTRAMRVEKSGMARTVRPDTTTRLVRSTHYGTRTRGWEEVTMSEKVQNALQAS